MQGWDLTRDWMYIGDVFKENGQKKHYPGKSHVKDNGGWPAWGDKDGDEAIRKTVLYMEVEREPTS